MITFHNVGARRSGVSLITGFNWRIEAGENWLIQGPNGSGKTLLLELLAGKTHPHTGELSIDFITGQSWDDRHAQRKRMIHYVPTHAVQSLLHQDQHQYYQQRYYSIGDQRQATVLQALGGFPDALDALKLPKEFSIDHLLELDVNRLSNGQLKKLLLVKVLLSGMPRLMLLDYPFEGLDQASRTALCNFIDYLIDAHSMQVVIVDHHNELPRRINKTLKLKRIDSTTTQDVHNVAISTQADSPSLTQQVDLPPDGEVESGSRPFRDSVVQLVDLKIQYGEQVILSGFNWHVRRGERWALVGRNGAGKTTLFSMIFADHPLAYSQHVYLFGRKRGTGESIWDIKRRISYLGPEQLSYLSPAHIHTSGYDYLLRSVGKADTTRLTQLLEAFQAETFLSLPVHALSSGQLQVMLIMQCLLKECELLLLDEPFQFLDSERKAALNHVLNTYLDESKTLILITHYADDLAQWTNYTKYL